MPERSDEHTTATIEPLSGRGAEPRRVTLVVYHRDGTELVPLEVGREVVIGRAPTADVHVPDRSLSRLHARVRHDTDGLFIEDLGSRNGTLVNGARVERARIQAGDDVLLGSARLAVHALDAVDPQLEGIDSHERFLLFLGDEIKRARSFGRSLAVLMIRALGPDAPHAAHWGPGLRESLRPVDRISLYGPAAALVLLSEAARDQAHAIAERMVDREENARLTCGVAFYPESGASADALVQAARAAVHRATRERRLVLAVEPRDERPAEEDEALVLHPRMRELFETARRLGSSLIPVLIAGETGTGKELLARTIHRSGPRREAPLRCINCGAIPSTLLESVLFGHERGAFTGAERRTPGLFEQAHGGTVLLDEIGELAPAAQAALLRVIETKRVPRLGGTREVEVDVRVVAATHRDLDAMCEAGRFRRDLYYRLTAMVLEVPPLRERRQEVLALAERFLRAAAAAEHSLVRAIHPEAQEMLLAYDWPGNVRELRNTIERAVVIARGDTVLPEDLPERVRRRAEAPMDSIVPDPPSGEEDDGGFKEKVRRYEAQLILDALRRHGWDRRKAARALDMPLRTMSHKMQLYGIRRGRGYSAEEGDDDGDLPEEPDDA